MKHKFLQLLCLSFGVASFALSAVVYGQLSNSQKDSCLVVGIHQPIGTSKQNVVSVITQVAQEFLTYQNVPLEISYVRTGAQFEVARSFFDSYSGESQENKLPEIEKQELIPIPQEPSQFKAFVSPEETALTTTVSTNTENAVPDEDDEKPTLRSPSL